MTHRTGIVLVVAAALILPVLPRPAAAQPAAHVERVFVNGAPWTADEERPRAEAMAVAGDKIVAAGGNAEIRALADEHTAVTDLTAIPPEQILSAEVVLTVMGGQQIFRSQAF